MLRWNKWSRTYTSERDGALNCFHILYRMWLRIENEGLYEYVAPEVESCTEGDEEGWVFTRSYGMNAEWTFREQWINNFLFINMFWLIIYVANLLLVDQIETEGPNVPIERKLLKCVFTFAAHLCVFCIWSIGVRCAARAPNI